MTDFPEIKRAGLVMYLDEGDGDRLYYSESGNLFTKEDIVNERSSRAVWARKLAELIETNQQFHNKEEAEKKGGILNAHTPWYCEKHENMLRNIKKELLRQAELDEEGEGLDLEREYELEEED